MLEDEFLESSCYAPLITHRPTHGFEDRVVFGDTNWLAVKSVFFTFLRSFVRGQNWHFLKSSGTQSGTYPRVRAGFFARRREHRYIVKAHIYIADHQVGAWERIRQHDIPFQQ